ncbi:MAG: hypothetical protein ACON5N_13350 [Akkermansiaceae bacterium]
MPLIVLLLLLLPGNGQEWRQLAGKLEAVSELPTHRFGMRDNGGRSMDCLEVFQAPNRGAIFGVYHTMKDKVFSVHLAQTKDLTEWEHVVVLDSHASQAAIHQTAEGAFMIALEKDAPNSCWIRLLHYPHFASLIQGKHQRFIDLPRSLAPTAEGTPSFESVSIPDGDLSQSVIKLRFHFYERARVDQLAYGTLTGFQDWKAEPSPRLNREFKKLGGLGNLGDRDPFQWHGKKYYVQEIQGKAGDWGSWGIYLCDQKGSPLQKLEFKTPKKAAAFANPCVSLIRLPGRNEDSMVFTAFIHRRGTHPSEAGQMIGVIP